MADMMSSLSRPLVGQRTKTLAQLVTLRLITGYTLLTVALVGAFGADWDIQWHATIGRDRTFTPPHDLILVAIGLNGVVALVSILIETWWARQNHELTHNSMDFLGILHSSVGSYLVGFGAVCSAIAFPLDTYWHSLYGIDVSLWAPFHAMLYIGGLLANFGVMYIFLSASHLAQSQQRVQATRLGYTGVIIVLAFLLSRLTTFIIPSIGLNLVNIDIFPFLLSLSIAIVYTLTIRVIPWRSTATLVTLGFLVAYFLLNIFIPPMMTWLMQVEHQTYLPNTVSLRSVVVPLLAQSPWFLLAGLSLDGIILLSRRAHWSSTGLYWGIVLATAVSVMIVATLQLIMLGLAGNASLFPFLLSLVLTVPGVLIGNWFGSTISTTVEELRS